jgi:hypothetical protein
MQRRSAARFDLITHYEVGWGGAAVKPEDFELLSGILKERSGLALTKEKVYLVESRLLPVARQRGLDGLDGLIAALRKSGEEPLLMDITRSKASARWSCHRS